MGEDRDRTKVDSLPLTCPVCGTFIIGMEAVSFGYESRRTDFRPQYTSDNPMKLYHHICPQCKFCAEEDYYSLELDKEQKAQLRERLAALHKKHGSTIERSLAARCHYAALVAEALQEMGLIYELPFDRAQSFVQAFWWSEPDERERFGEQALRKLRDSSKQVAEGSEDYLYILYMEGEISRRLGRPTEAKRHFEKLLALGDKRQNESNKFLFDLARQQMTSPKDELPEESLNPYNNG